MKCFNHSLAERPKRHQSRYITSEKTETDHWPSGNWRANNGNSPMQDVNSRWSVTRTGRWVSACTHLLARLSATGGPQPCGWIGNNNNKMAELCELNYGLSTWEIVLEARCKCGAQWLFSPIPRWVVTLFCSQNAFQSRQSTAMQRHFTERW